LAVATMVRRVVDERGAVRLEEFSARSGPAAIDSRLEDPD
jgi:hypothetical protein